MAQIEAKKLPETVVISGTSYFFSDRTMTKLGFKSVAPSAFYRFNLMVNMIDLTWMYCLAQGRFGIPKLWKAKKATIVGSELMRQKEFIVQLRSKLMHRI